MQILQSECTVTDDFFFFLRMHEAGTKYPACSSADVLVLQGEVEQNFFAVKSADVTQRYSGPDSPLPYTLH